LAFPIRSLWQRSNAFFRPWHEINVKISSDPGRMHLAPLTLALYQPDIPQNCGTMLRLCACLGLAAAIIEPAGFPASDRAFRRAGLDYLDHVEIARHASFAAFLAWRKAEGRRLILLSTKADEDYRDFRYAPGDVLLVGRESAGVPDEVRHAVNAGVRIPLRPPLRSLNVAVAAAMVLGEALRQLRVEEGKQGCE
jgi:tRNA (cytidine/uridine-2'-O-)-methyltransferase